MKKKTTEALYPETPATDSEIFFQLSDSGKLRLEMQKFGRSIVDSLAYGVLSNPLDLRNQVRRIIAYGETNERENLYGALIDLFIVLGSQGKSLRSRLLNQYRNQLSEPHYRVLLQCENSNVTADLIPNCPSSVLSKGLVGTRRLLKTKIGNGEDGVVRDVLEEVKEYLEYSQIDTARQILERAILQDPSRVELHTELLALYRAGRDIENFQKIDDQLQLTQTGNLYSDEWAAVSEFLLESGEHA